MKKHWLLLPIAASSCVLPLVGCGPTPEPIPKDKFEKMYDYYLALVLNTTKTDDYKDKTVDQILEELDIETHEEIETYFFKNINYTEQDAAIWPAHQHILRALQIAVLAKARNNPQLMDIANKLTLYWLCHDYQNTANNWWFNEIGVPRDLGSLALIVFDNLNETFQNEIIERINRGTLNGCAAAKGRTGTNLFWHAEISIKYCVLTKSQSEFDTVIYEVNDEIKEDDEEGFQSDGSYYQHGRQMYTGGYGRQGALMLCRILGVMSKAGYEWDLNKLRIVTNFILNGVRYFTKNNSFNYSCMGRTYTRKTSFNIDAGTTDLGNIDEFRYILDVTNLPSDDKQEIESLIKCWRNNQSTFYGVHYFPKSCFITMSLDGIYMSFKGTMEGLINCEKTNGENELAYNMSYGTNTCVMETGNEYNNMAPLWDYASLPGTTSLTESDEELKAKSDYIGTTRMGTFAGGMIGNVAYSMQRTSHGNTNLQVTCFGTDKGMVILGSNLNDIGGGILHTTVEQCTPNADEITSADHKTVTHSNVVYTNIMENSKFAVTNKITPGNWSRNNNTYSGEEGVNGSVLTIKINNSDATNKDRYAYVIQPKSMIDKKFELIVNDENYHAVLLPSGNQIAAAFYENGSFEYQGQTYSGEKGKYYLFDKI